MRFLTVLFVVAMTTGCGGDPKPAPPAAASKPAAPKPADESRRLPKANLLDSRIVDDHLMGKAFMPGGTLGSYRKSKTEYEIFIAKAPAPADAALVLLEWKRALSSARLVPAFGAYSGQDAGVPVFVFTKGPWIAGIRGLADKDADPVARTLASAL